MPGGFDWGDLFDDLPTLIIFVLFVIGSVTAGAIFLAAMLGWLS